MKNGFDASVTHNDGSEYVAHAKGQHPADRVCKCCRGIEKASGLPFDVAEWLYPAEILHAVPSGCSIQQMQIVHRRHMLTA